MKLNKFREEAIKKKDIELLYEYIDIVNEYNDNDENIEEVYELILGQAMEASAEYISSARTFDVGNKRERLYVRALYEHAISLYSEKNLHQAKELFLLLEELVKDTQFQDAFETHALAVEHGVSLDELLNKYADQRSLKEGDVFVLKFKKELDARFL